MVRVLNGVSSEPGLALNLRSSCLCILSVQIIALFALRVEVAKRTGEMKELIPLD